MAKLSVLAATTLGLTHIGSNRIPIRPKARLCFTAPIRRSVIVIVKLLFARVRHFADVHRLVTDVQTVRPERDFG